MNKTQRTDKWLRIVLERVLRNGWNVRMANQRVSRRTAALSARRLSSAPLGALVRHSWEAQIQKPSPAVLRDQRAVREELYRRGFTESAQEVQRWAQREWLAREAAEDAQDALATQRGAVRAARRDAFDGVEGSVALGMVMVAAVEAARTAEDLERLVPYLDPAGTELGMVESVADFDVTDEVVPAWKPVDEAQDAFDFAEGAYPEGVAAAVAVEQMVTDSEATSVNSGESDISYMADESIEV